MNGSVVVDTSLVVDILTSVPNIAAAVERRGTILHAPYALDAEFMYVAHFGVRHEMLVAAHEQGIDPEELSFENALHVISPTTRNDFFLPLGGGGAAVNTSTARSPRCAYASDPIVTTLAASNTKQAATASTTAPNAKRSPSPKNRKSP